MRSKPLAGAVITAYQTPIVRHGKRKRKMGRTKIDYLTHTWNPLSMRCTPCSPGCDHCWHLIIAKRLANNFAIIYGADQRAYAGGPFVLNQRKLEAPLHWRKPARIGVQFMGDLFHENVLDEWIDSIFEIMDRCPQHTFFGLTKRPENLKEKIWGNTCDFPRVITAGDYIPNLYLGVTVCNQEEADMKIPELLRVPGFKKWVSYEPALGPLDLWKADYPAPGGGFQGAVTSWPGGLDWIVAGCETGPGARPAHPDWFRSLRDQCQAAGVPFFLKKIGKLFTHGPQGRTFDGREWDELPT
jgi:protein gp37